jgi:site-specific DNA-methyltransferase (adenine-specific)
MMRDTMQTDIPELNTITVGDALEFVSALPDASIPLYLFSPPYNLGNTSGGGFAKTGHYADGAPMKKRGGQGKWTPKSSGSWLGNSPAIADGYGDYKDNMPHAEYVAWQHAILRECWRTLTPAGAIYYNHKPRVMNGVLVEPRDYVPPELPLRQRIIWARAGGINFSPTFYLPTYEEILIIAKPDFRLKSKGASGAGDVWSISQEAGTWHPAPFPLELAERVIETTMPAFVCDPFMGRGTTAVAAKKFGVDYLGNELNAGYAEKARAWVARTRKMTLRQTTITDVLAEQQEALI